MAELLNMTNQSVEGVAPPATGRLEYKDTKVPGLYLRVSASGVRTFSFVGRAKGASRPERATIGRYPQVKAEEARTRARQISGQLADGVSVATARRTQRQELTLTELRKLWEPSRKKRKGTQKAPDDSPWRLWIEPAFGRRRLSEITAGAVEAWLKALPKKIVKANLDRIAEAAAKRAERRQRIEAAQAGRRRGPIPKERPPARATRINGEATANKALEELRAMYSWAINPRRGHFKGDNPAAGQDAFARVERERFLYPDEMTKFFTAMAQVPSETMRDFFLIALLTGARRSNVAAMAWPDVNLDRGEWKVAGALMKNGRPQTITLGDEAVGILRNRKPAKGGSAWVFPSARSESGHIVEPKRAWANLLAAAGIDDLRIHDLRRTLGSWQARTGASLVVIGKSLNHKDQQSTQIYARLDLDPVRQSVDRATSAMFEAAAVKPTAEVIDLKGAKATKAGKGEATAC